MQELHETKYDAWSGMARNSDKRHKSTVDLPIFDHS